MFFDRPFGGVIPGVNGAVLGTLMRTGTPLTGRQIHALVSDDYSLWNVQQGLRAVAALGLVQTQTIGRAGVHTINEHHVAVAALRRILDPITLLIEVVTDAVGDDVSAVVLFGSIARGEATASSDVDLAIVAPPGWDGRALVEDAVRTRLGNDCDVLVLGREELDRSPDAREPVVQDILSEGVALLGSLPPIKSSAV